MITCPNCNHQNPDGALQCEACYTPLPEMVTCPNCGAPVQENASFCGQCGNDLRDLSSTTPAAPSTPSNTLETEVSTVPDSSLPTQNFLTEEASATPPTNADFELPDLIEPDPLIVPDPISPHSSEPIEEASTPVSSTPEPPNTNKASSPSTPPPTPISAPAVSTPTPPTPTPAATPPVATQLQVTTARLRHAQTDTTLELPRQLSIIRIGKPNDQTPPDIDVSGFPDSEIVSRVHANLRVEGDTYYLEDVGSSNGTYVNGLPLPIGNRHRLRAGDRIALGKGDKVSFIFENT